MIEERKRVEVKQKEREKLYEDNFNMDEMDYERGGAV